MNTNCNEISLAEHAPNSRKGQKRNVIEMYAVLHLSKNVLSKLGIR